MRAVPVLLLASGLVFASGLRSGDAPETHGATAGSNGGTTGLASSVRAVDEGRPGPGARAPRFRLNDHNGNRTAVGGESEGDRWTVLAFYPKALTPG